MPLELGVRFLRNDFSVEEVRTPADQPYRLVNVSYIAAGHIEAYLTTAAVSDGIDPDAIPP